MMGALRWIGQHILALFKYCLTFIRTLTDAVLSLLSCFMTYVIAAISYLVYLVFDELQVVINRVLGNLLSLQIPSVDVVPFAQWICHDIVALDVAYTGFLAYLAIWIACRAARGGWTGIRAILDLL